MKTPEPALPKLERVEAAATVFASPVQKLMVASDWSGGDPKANLSACLRLDGAVDADALRKSLDGLIARHEGLRSRFAATPEGIELRTGPRVRCPFETEDASGSDGASCEQLREIGLRHLDAPFDLAHGPLIRATYVPDGGGGQLVLGLHHAVSDGWSISRLGIELGELYGQDGGRDRAAPFQLRDHVAWQDRCRATQAFDGALAFWNDALGGRDLAMDVMPARAAPGPARGLSSLHHVRRHFGGERARRTKAAMAARFANPFATFFGAAAIMLRAQASRDDIVCAVPFLNRHQAGSLKIVGPLSNVLPCPADVRAGMRIETLERQLRDFLAATRRHQFVHASVVGAHLAAQARGPTRRPNVLFNYLFFADAGGTGRVGISLHADATVGAIPSWCDLAFQIYEQGDGWSIEVLGFDDFLKPVELEAFGRTLEALVETCAGNPSGTVGALDGIARAA